MNVRRAVPLVVALATVAFARVVWNVPSGVLVQGALIGGLSSLVALGIALVWRANRAVNFAAGDLGAIPATLAVLLVIGSAGLGWWGGLGVGLVTAVLLGVLVETLVIRRFARAPRLVLSVATIGMAQLLAAGSLLLADQLNVSIRPIPAPFDAHFTIDPIHFGGKDIAAFVAVPVAFIALWLFLRRSDIGIAIRGAAERVDRAATLGIPVRRLQTVVWVIATVLAFLAVYLREGVVGVSLGTVLGPAILLRALAAAVIGRMDRLPIIAGAAILLGVVEQSVLWHWRADPAYVDPALFVVVVIGLVVARRAGAGRAEEASSWQAARELRPVPRALSDAPAMRAARWAPRIGVAALLVAVPTFLSESQINLAAAILLFAIVGLSLVVLTGWIGQVSLGQMALVAVGAAVGGAVTDRLGWDLSIALVLGGAAGALAAVLIGLPALRRRGLTLAVTSLAFALMTSSFLLNRKYFGTGATLDWLPGERITRTKLFGAIAVDTETRFYYLCVLALALAYALVRGIRRSRTGRLLIAVRENEHNAEAFGISARRAMIGAFAFSGFLAGFAGALFVHHQSGLSPGPYAPTESLQVFTMTVIGGLGSASGALLGATYLRGIQYYLSFEWQLLLTGAGLVLVLLVFPGGLGGLVADARDALVRRVARRRGLIAPGSRPPPEGTPPVEPTETTTTSAGPVSGSEPVVGRRLAVEGLDVAYDGVQVLFDVDVFADDGEVVAVLGTNGSGKSTLLRAISGIADVTGGRVLLDGVDQTRTRPEQIAALGVASVPGGYGTFPSLTVAEHMRLAGWTRRDDGEARAAATDAAFERFPALRTRATTAAGDLSGGEQQMLTLAMAFVMQPRLLLLDELSLGLAPVIVHDLLAGVRELAEGGTTVVLVEQSVELALQVAHRAYFLEDGTIRSVGPTKELLARPDLVRAVFLSGATGTITDPAVVVPAPSAAAPAPAITRGTPRLEVQGVAKRYGGIDALRDVSFSVAPGEILGVLGPNGAGKTTLFDVVSGFQPADEGSIRLQDADGRVHDVTHRSPSARAGEGLGRAFQDARLFPALTVAETIAVALDDEVPVHDPIAAALNLPAVYASERVVEQQVDELVTRFGLDAYHDAFVRELSTGTRRIVELACVFARRPTVLLLDEPSAGLAQAETTALAPLLRSMRDDLGTAVVVIEHDVGLLRSVADRLVVLDLGRVIADGAPEATLADPLVAAAYLGPVDVAGVPST